MVRLPACTRAREAVRSLNLHGSNARPVTVLIRGGEYRLAEPFVLGPGDSGAKGCPVTYAAYPGERPVFSGGQRIGGWQREQGDLWSTEVPEATFRAPRDPATVCQWSSA